MSEGPPDSRHLSTQSGVGQRIDTHAVVHSETVPPDGAPPAGQGRRRWMAIVWPAFLAAAALEMLVFALVDPHEISLAGRTLQWPAIAVYTASFFLFWGVALIGTAQTALLSLEPDEVNRPPVSGKPGD